MIKMRDLLNEILKENDSETIQMYLDIIADDPDNPRFDKYKEILLSKFGVDWKEQIKDDDYLNNIDVDNIKDKKEFRNWDTYVKYAKEVYRSRNIGEPRLSISKEIPLKYVESVLRDVNLKVKFREYSGKGNYAQHTSGLIEIPDPCDLGTLIHEIGHEFDEKVYKDGISKKNTNATSSYGIGNAGEVFAENFMHFFLASSWLKSKMPHVWADLNSRITSNWKNIIKKFMQYKD